MRFISNRKKASVKDPTDVLKGANVWRKDEWQRVAMTVSCHDADYIPKVKDAGKIKSFKGKKVQVMHNGVLVLARGYHGDWMSQIIKKLKGHHEPQEEMAFYEVTKRLGSNPSILELGSFWSYYSIWLLKEFTDARALACEPDPANIKIGRINAQLNGVSERITFTNFAAGREDGKKIRFMLDSDQSKMINAKVRSVDSLLDEYEIDKLSILHMDVQGVELDALHGSLKCIREKRIRFVFVSTHHYLFSGDPLTHQKCKQFLIDNGAHIIAAHNVLESFSGDGLIVASFDKRDKDMHLDLSLNSTDDSLFRPYEEDIALLLEHIKK